jgi:ubiquinone biosynthesis protein UbiJ
MDPGDVMAFVALMTALGVLGVAFSPIGRALAERLRGKGREPAIDPAELDALQDELANVRRQVAELAERQDFTERLLARAREREQLSAPKER